MGRGARRARCSDGYAGAPTLRLRLVAPERVRAILAHALLEPSELATTPACIGLTELQARGAAQAAAIIDRYGGVIVADSVGMGKTYIALRLIEHAVAAGTPVVVVVPATLRTKWRTALRAAGLDRASHDITLVTHAVVHRMTPPTTEALVVVDEAHQFRNPRTARYRALALICARAQVVLLTATPINNRPADLYWLLRLFLGDGALYDAGVPDLRVALREPDATTHADLARRVVSRVVVRRTRADLAVADHTSTPATDARTAHAAGPPHLRFPRRHTPRAVSYDLRSACPALIDTLETTFASLRLSAFDATGNTHTATGSLIRIGLLKRLESSTDAFRASLVRLLRFLDAFDESVACGNYLRPRDTRTGDPLQFSFTGLLARPIPRTVDRAQLAIDVAADRDVLRKMLATIPTTGIGAKTAALTRLLDTLGDVPRVVFTEFADTAEALFAALPKDGVALLHGTRAALASGPVSRRAVLERFAPVACRVSPPPSHERILTLIATDVLAEGLDLQDAQHCISFDLPWNPVRLMQRAGRIDRLGSPHDDVFVWYFEPTTELERLLGLMRRLGAKVRTIEQTVGVEHAVFGQSHGEDSGASDTVDAAAAADDGGAARAALRALGSRGAPASRPGPRDSVPDAPHRGPSHPRAPRTLASCVSDRAVDAPTLLLARRAGASTWVEGVRLRPGPPEYLDPADIGRLLVALDAGTGEEWRQGRAAVSDALVAYRALNAGQPGDSSAVVQQTALRLRCALAQLPGSPVASLCHRADRILRSLRHGLRAGGAHAVHSALREHRTSDAAALIEALETALASGRSRAARRPVRTVAVLLVEPAGGAEIDRATTPAYGAMTRREPSLFG